MKNEIQLDSESYYILDKWKNSIPLFARITYRYQLNSIIDLKPNKILEIWVWSNILSSYLRLHWYNLTTFDHDSSLKPDFVWDFIQLPFKDEAFDTVACFEVLEHVTFDDSISALKEMRRISKKNVIISVPYSWFYINISFSNFYCNLFKKIYDFLGWTPHEPRNLTIKIPFFL